MSNPVGHVAIIMDGNGRWATSRSHKRSWGHIRGASHVSKIIETADELGVGALTLYAFSSENWSRPSLEIQILFKLLVKFIKKERKRILKNNIRFQVIGSTEGLFKEAVDLIQGLEAESKHNTGLKLNFAFGYGSRQEMISAINQFIEENPGKKIDSDQLDEQLFTHDCGDVDLLIRTGGDQRISNFLLWQIAYAELFFTKTLWPDFTTDEFSRIINSYKNVERRFGGLGNQTLEKTMNKAHEQKGNI